MNLILQHIYYRQMTEPVFEPQFFCCLSKYCNHSDTETDYLFDFIYLFNLIDLGNLFNLFLLFN